MQATDIHTILEAVRQVEKNSLCSALGKHGGAYAFNTQENPVSVAFKGDDGPHAGLVLQARTTRNRNNGITRTSVRILVNDDRHDEYEIGAEDLFPGQMSVVTDAIPKD